MVNKVSLNDYKRFYELGSLINDNFSNLYNLEELLNSDIVFIIGYYVKDNLIGFIHFVKTYETIDIINVIVDIEYRNQGIATSLIESIFNDFDDINEIFLEVNENNLAALKLYKKCGFYEINRRYKYYGDDTAIIMKRDV